MGVTEGGVTGESRHIFSILPQNCAIKRDQSDQSAALQCGSKAGRGCLYMDVDPLESKLWRQFPAHFPVLVLEYGRKFCGEGQVPCMSQGYWAVL